MGKATLGVTALPAAGGENLAGDTMLTIDVGRGAGVKKQLGTVGQDILGVNSNLKLGNNIKGRNPAAALDDHAPNLPSGYDIHGNPTYGDGKVNLTTTWAADYHFDKAQASLRYGTPLTPVKKKYSEFTS